MTLDEGYIKYRSDWIAAPVIDADVAKELDTWRRPLFEAGLIGHYQDQGIGYGNLSVRAARGGFYISGTQTGQLPRTDGRHYSHVTRYDIDGNSIECRGPMQASSESLTHAAIYECDEEIAAIVHVHSSRLWTLLKDRIPSTDERARYGTPEMAREFARLYQYTKFADLGIAIMAGHVDGLISIGESLEQAALRMLDLNREFD